MPTATDIQTEQNTNAPAKQGKAKRPDFGNGRYSPLMDEVYDDSQTVYKLSPDKAEKLARKIATDLGAIMASQPVEVKLGKMNKDGKLTISEASKLKGFTVTLPIFALKGLHYAAEAGKNGFSFADTDWKPSNQMSEYLNSL